MNLYAIKAKARRCAGLWVMKIFVGALFFSLLVVLGCRGARGNTQFKVVSEKGMIFLSNNYLKYLDTLKKTDDINFVFLPDIFVPIRSIDLSSSLYDNFRAEERKFGMELREIANRDQLLSLGKLYRNDPSGQTCYTDTSFALVPVNITYKLWKYDPGVISCEASVILNVNGVVDSFRYSTPTNEIISIKLLERDSPK